MEILRVCAQVVDLDVAELILWHRLETKKANSLLDYLLSLVLGDVTVDVPEHSTTAKPLSLHLFKLLIRETFQNL